MPDFVREIFSTEVQGRDGVLRGTDLWTGVHVDCEKIASLAPAVGYRQGCFETWGSVNFFRVAEAAGYPREKYEPKTGGTG